MCRYSDHQYLTHNACFSCRRSFKGGEYSSVCPRCRGPLVTLGRDFHRPRQADRKAWKAAEMLARAGVTFDSCGCGGPGPRPHRPRDVKPFLEAQRLEKARWAAGPQLLNRYLAGELPRRREGRR